MQFLTLAKMPSKKKRKAKGVPLLWTSKVGVHHPHQESTPAPEGRPIVFSDKYFHKAKSTWYLFFLSLPIDIIIFNLGIGASWLPKSQQTLSLIILVLLGISVLALLRNYILMGFSLAKHFRNRLIVRSGKLAFWVIAVIVVGFLFTEAYLRQSKGTWLSVLFSVLAAVGAAIPAMHAIKERLLIEKRKDRNRLLWFEESDRQRYASVMIPVFIARALSLLAAIYYYTLEDYLLYFVLALCMLLLFEPKESDFFVLCKRCLSKTSRSLAGLRYCPKCARVKFRVPAAAINL